MAGSIEINHIDYYNPLHHTSYEALAEAELWQAFKNGDKHALSQLFRKYYKPLTNYGLNIYTDCDLIKDCIQELFLDLWLYRERLNQVNSVKFYILTCFRRRMMRNLEAMNKNKHYDLKTNYRYTMASSFETDMIREQSENEKKHHVIKELANLTKRQQEAIYLKFYQEQSYENIALIMSLNYQSVKNLIHNGIKSLRTRLQHKEILA